MNKPTPKPFLHLDLYDVLAYLEQNGYPDICNQFYEAAGLYGDWHRDCANYITIPEDTEIDNKRAAFLSMLGKALDLAPGTSLYLDL